jgi:hypothetical protein
MRFEVSQACFGDFRPGQALSGTLARMQAEPTEALREVRVTALRRHRAQRWGRIELAQVEPAMGVQILQHDWREA